MFRRPSAGGGAGATRLLALLMAGGVLAGVARAQVADSTAARPDTAARPPLPPVGFPAPEDGRPAGHRLPVREPALDLQGLLSAVPGAFIYDFGTPGWPDGWSADGLRPDAAAVFLDAIPFDDLITGRPRYDLVPMTFLEPLRLADARDGAPVSVMARLRAFDVPQPLTEMRYRTSNTGLQGVTVMHAQQHPVRFLGRPARYQVLVGYGGQGARGEYPGSRLRRARRLLGRLRFEQRGWSVELLELFNRRRVGAHGGVLPLDPSRYETIYQRLGAIVEEPDARRETFRNDLALTVRARLLPPAFAPTTATAFRTSERLQYRNPSDTLTWRMRRTGFRLVQDARWGGHRLRLRAELRHDGLRPGAALPDTAGLSRNQAHLTLRDSLRVGRLGVVLAGGWHRDDGITYPSGRADLTFGTARHRLFARVGHGGAPVSRVALWGFGGVVEPLARRPDSRLTLGRVGFTVHAGPFDLTAYAFAWRETRPVDLYATGRADTVAARVAASALTYAGVAADLGWRRHADRGLYLTFQPSLGRIRDPEADPLFARRAGSLPETYATGRLGARMRLFQGDLDLDLYLRGRYWGAMRSRLFHPQTGLLVVPLLQDRHFPRSGALDVYFVGGIRGATVFLAYENVLSGTRVQVGNLIVPDYPLPRHRFRFGVFWPILN